MDVALIHLRLLSLSLLLLLSLQFARITHVVLGLLLQGFLFDLLKMPV